jgi:hypothetical protein
LMGTGAGAQPDRTTVSSPGNGVTAGGVGEVFSRSAVAAAAAAAPPPIRATIVFGERAMAVSGKWTSDVIVVGIR